MISLDREIRPEDFAVDPQKEYTSVAARDEARREREELKRLYEIQETLKAKALYKAEQARKDQIPYSEKLVTEICERISAGDVLFSICQDADMPTVRSVNRWLKEYAVFSALHKEAVNDRLNVFEDQLVTISDESENDYKTVVKGKKATKVVDAEVVSRAKLRIDVRKAHLRAYRPDRWAETSTLITKSVDDVFDLSHEELETKLAELETKQDNVRAA